MQDEDITSCSICYEPFSATRLYTVGACDHSGICSLCALRNRHLLNDYSCSFCKQDMEYVVCSTNPQAQFHHFERWGDDIGAEFEFDCKSRMFFPKQYYKSEVCPLKQHVCPEPACKGVYRDLKTLKKHLTTEHGKMQCDLCAENKKIFPAEQLTYTHDEFSRHLKTGDCDGSRGHPSCRFCKKRFYDIDGLFQHLEREHISCHICSQDSASSTHSSSSSQNLTYYKDYSSLHTHFRKNHHICQEEVCLENKFIVFSNQISLILHHKQFHPSSQLSANPTVSINNSCHTHTSKQRATTCCSHYEGGCGGVVVDGEWEVKLEAAHFLLNRAEKDPLVPAHHLPVSMDFSSEYEYPSIATSTPTPSHTKVIDNLLSLDKRFKHNNNHNNTRSYKSKTNSGTSYYLSSDFPSLEEANIPTTPLLQPPTRNMMADPGEQTITNTNTTKSSHHPESMSVRKRSPRPAAGLGPSWGSALCGLTGGATRSSSTKNKNTGGNNYKKLSVYKPDTRRGLNNAV